MDTNDLLRVVFTIGDIVSKILPYILTLSGFLLFIFLTSAGLDYMLASGDPKKMEAAKEKLTAAIIGFIIVFTAFWIFQIINYIFGLK